MGTQHHVSSERKSSSGLDGIPLVVNLDHIADTLDRSRTGAVVLRTGTRPLLTHLLDVVSMLGTIGTSDVFPDVRTIRNDPCSARSVAMSLRAHREHTDGSFLKNPPREFALQVVRPCRLGGGKSIIVPIAGVLDLLGADTLQILESHPVRFERNDGLRTDGYAAPVLRHDERALLRWRNDSEVWPVAVHPCEEIAWALEMLTAAVDAAPRHRFSLHAGDILVVDNQRCLHGRTSLFPGSERELRRVWIF